ncbi:hypothetical protein G9A89_013105 [Geosiphon pyriformis]|nr:hypothetical protein G9A89_013105 [Geosiphon pyriformis]
MFADQLLNSHGECFNWKNFRHWKCLNPRGPVLLWFTLVLGFVKDGGLVKGASPAVESPLKLDVLDMNHFSFVCSSLKNASLPVILVYTDGSVKNFGTFNAVGGAATYFSDLGLHVGVEVHGLLSSTLAEMQAIVLALECVLAFSDVIVLSDSQASLDACQAESSLVVLDFHNRCWAKVKSYSGVLGNEHADCLADTTTSSGLFLPANIKENFLLADGRVISGKACRFIRIVNDTVRRFQWEFGPGSSVVDFLQIGNINWFCTVSVWHPDSHMSAGYTSRTTASLCTYLMKALHRRLPVTVRKCLYNRNYPSVSCIHCGKSLASSVSNGDLYTALCKSLVLDDWLTEAKTFFVDSKLAMSSLVKFIRSLQCGSLGVDRSLCNIVWGLPTRISDGVAHLLGVNRGYTVSFGLSSSHLFFISAAGEVTTTTNSIMSKKKTLKGAFHGPADSSFSQKRKVVLGNIKHSGDKRDISLSKSGSGDNIYFDVESLFGNDENVSMSGVNINTGAVFGSPLSSLNFHIDDNKIVLFSHLSISLNKKWIDPKIIKTPVEVLIKKLFALNINLLAVKKNWQQQKLN